MLATKSAAFKRDALDQFLQAFNRHRLAERKGDAVFYLGADGEIDVTTITTYSGPARGDAAEPWVFRISINGHSVRITKALCRRLGMPKNRQRCELLQTWSRGGLEMSVLPDELAAFSRWAAWVSLARSGLAVEIPPTPHLSSWAGMSHRNYDWSRRAAAAYDTWHTARKLQESRRKGSR